MSQRLPGRAFTCLFNKHVLDTLCLVGTQMADDVA